MIRFYAPDIAIVATLDPTESAHAVRVLRKRIGDPVEVVDGKGNLFRCRIADDNPRGALLTIEDRSPLPKVWKPALHIALAPTKHMDRMEWLVEKLVEIGVDSITPVLCRRSERRELKSERLVKIAVSAMKQSLKAVLPQVAPLTPLPQFLADAAAGDRFIGYCSDSTPRCLLAKAYTPGRDCTVLIGPEGDFTPEEVQAAIDAGFAPATMGDNRLRTETAALVAADTFHVVNQLNNY